MRKSQQACARGTLSALCSTPARLVKTQWLLQLLFVTTMASAAASGAAPTCTRDGGGVVAGIGSVVIRGELYNVSIIPDGSFAA